MRNLSDFAETGIHHFPDAVDSAPCAALLEQVLGLRTFDESLFLSEQEFLANPQFKGVNPVPGRNLADQLGESVSFIDSNPDIGQMLTAILGPDYTVRDRKFVCGVPVENLPQWVSTQIRKTGVKNLGPYVRPEYRDITYFSGIDFHQDIIDWPSGGPTFITMYVYLSTVGATDAPLHVIPGSHVLGATTFPHDLNRFEDGEWQYSDRKRKAVRASHHVLVGGPGDVNLWHPFILHGTQADANSHARISLRYLVEAADREVNGEGALARLNRSIDGPLSLESTRLDLDDAGKAILSGNTVDEINPSH